MEMLVVGSKSKEAMKKGGYNVGSDALEGLNEILYWYISQAQNRCTANGRKTIRKHDILA